MTTKKDIEHIADLARIELPDLALGTFETEFDFILNFVGELSGADTGGVPDLSLAMEGALPIDSTREDIERLPLGDAQALIDAAPKTEGRWISVRVVF